MQVPTRISTEDQARQFLSQIANVEVYNKTDEHGAYRLVSASCERCGGSGYIAAYERVNGGVCYACGGDCTKGATKRSYLLHDARQEAAKLRRQARRVAKIAREEAETAKAVESFLAQHEGLAEALATDVSFLRDLNRQLTEKGSLSAKQVEVALRVASEEAKPKVHAPSGRVEVVGKVLRVVTKDTDYGVSTRMTVETVEGWRVNTTVPAALFDGKELTGAEVRFTATLESTDKVDFVFGKRPAKASRV